MKIHRSGLVSVLAVMALSVALLMGCEEREATEESGEALADSVLLGDHTPRPATEGSQELESRIRGLFLEIEEKESALTALEDSLNVRAAELDASEERLATRWTVSWLVLILGILGIIIGFVLSRRRQEPLPSIAQTAPKPFVTETPPEKPQEKPTVTPEDRPSTESEAKAPAAKKTKAKTKAKAKSKSTRPQKPPAKGDSD